MFPLFLLALMMVDNESILHSNTFRQTIKNKKHENELNGEPRINIETNLEINIETNLETNIETNIETNLETNIETKNNNIYIPYIELD